MSEKRFTSDEEGNILDDGDILTVAEVLKYLNWYRRDMLRFSVENEQLRKQVAEYEMILRQHEFAEYINKLQEEIAFWKKWALEYLTNYDIYTDEFLKTLESIEGEEIVQRIRERQNEIIKILKKEELL